MTKQSTLRETESDRIAIAHEHYYERGGGEHVAEALARTFETDIYTGFVNDGTTPDDVAVHGLFGDGLSGSIMRRNNLPAIMFRDAYYQFAWQHVPELYDHDIIIQSGNNPGWFVPKDDQVIVKYVHSPPRNPYDQFHQSIDTDCNPWDLPTRAANLVKRLYTKSARQFYETNTAYPDVYVANSELVARRINQSWGIDYDDIEIVYPPVDTDSYGPEYADMPDEEYYLTFSRLTEKKNIDDIIHACNELDAELVVGGSGPERDYLESIAGPTITFTSYMSESEKRRRLAEANAFIFNADNEDFGLCPVEAMAAGTPVLGVADGFTEHQIIDGKNGYTFPRSAGKLRECIRYYGRQGVDWSPDRIQRFAERFDISEFRRRMREIVSDAQAKVADQIEPDWQPVGDLDGGDSREAALADGGVESSSSPSPDADGAGGGVDD